METIYAITKGHRWIDLIDDSEEILGFIVDKNEAEDFCTDLNREFQASTKVSEYDKKRVIYYAQLLENLSNAQTHPLHPLR